MFAAFTEIGSEGLYYQVQSTVVESSWNKKVYMAVPREDRATEALERVEREGREPGLGEVIWHELDLKDPRDAKASAQAFLEKESRLDILSWFIVFFRFH